MKAKFAAADPGSLLGRGILRQRRQPGRHDAKPGQSWQAAGFEAIITFGLVLMVLNRHHCAFWAAG